MIEQICNHIKNFFVYEKDFDTFVIENGKLKNTVAEGTFYRIMGSVKNDGVYSCKDSLIDETFYGAVWVMRPPKDFVELVEEIEQFSENRQPTAYTSESFGGYSYTMATDDKGMPVDWKAVFSSRLDAYRKVRIL